MLFSEWRKQYHELRQSWRLPGFARVLFWSDKFQQRFSMAGRLWIAAIVVCMLFGANTRTSMIYQLLAALFALFMVALLYTWLKSWRAKEQLQVSRQLPDLATVGQEFSYRFELSNISNHDMTELRISERGKRLKPTLHQFENMAEPDEQLRNWYDRKTGFYRFKWLRHWLRGAEFKAVQLDLLKAGKRSSVDIRLKPLRRGMIHFESIRLAQPDPLGLVYLFEEHRKYQSLLVLPKRYEIPRRLKLEGGRVYQQGGLAMSSVVGEAEEFHSLREYRPGDSPRHLHWPSLARSAKPMVKVFQDEYFTRQALILDSFADETAMLRFEEAISLAAGFATTVESDDALLDLLFVGEAHTPVHVEELTAGRALAHPEQMLEALAALPLCPTSGFSALADMVLDQADSVASCLLVFLSWDEPRQAFVRQLLARSMPLRVFLIIDENQPAVEPGVMDGFRAYFHPLRVGSIQQDLIAIDHE